MLAPVLLLSPEVHRSTTKSRDWNRRWIQRNGHEEEEREERGGGGGANMVKEIRLFQQGRIELNDLLSSLGLFRVGNEHGLGLGLPVSWHSKSFIVGQPPRFLLPLCQANKKTMNCQAGNSYANIKIAYNKQVCQVAKGA